MTGPTDAEIEAVARALALVCDERRKEIAAIFGYGPEMPGDWPRYIEEARAAILASRKVLEAQGMVILPREPTEAMLKACDDTFPGEPINARGVGCAAWRAMIDAAEAEG